MINGAHRYTLVRLACIGLLAVVPADHLVAMAMERPEMVELPTANEYPHAYVLGNQQVGEAQC